MGQANTFLNKKREESRALGMGRGPGQPVSHLLSSPPGQSEKC